MKVLTGLCIFALAAGFMVSAVDVQGNTETGSDAVVVKINDQVITEKEVAAETDKRVATQATRMPEGMQIEDWMRDQIRTSVVDMMIEQALVTQTLAAKEIEITDEQIMAEIAQIAESQNLELEDVSTEIARFGMTMDDLKSQIRMKLNVDTLIDAEMKDKDVKDEDVKTFYDENPQYFERPEQVRVAHVLVLTQGKSEAEQDAAKKTIEDVLEKAKAGEDFATLAKEYSEDPGSKDQGGEYTFPRGQMVPEFEQAAFTMQDGQISDIVTTQYGYHVLKKLGHLEAVKEPFDAVKEQIKDHLSRQKRAQFWEAYSETLREKATIELSEAETQRREQSAQPPMMPQMMPQG